jgi:hypothetical protein
VSQLGSQAGNLLLVILQVLILGLASVNQLQVFVTQILVFVLKLIKLLGRALEPTREVGIVSDKGQGYLLLESGDEVGPCFFYGPYHILVMQVERPGMAQDVLSVHEAWATHFVMTDCDGLAQVVDCPLSVIPLSGFDQRRDAAMLGDIELHP